MLINNTNILAFNARQHRVQIGHNSIKNGSEWPSGNVLPYMGRNSWGFKDITVFLVVKGENREAIQQNCSAIIAALKEPAELTLDGYTHKFMGILQDYSVDETSMRRWHTLRLNFDGYEFGEDTGDYMTTDSRYFVNPGNIVSPCRVIITAEDDDIGSITLTGICRDSFTGADLPVTVTNIAQTQTVVIDGINGSIDSGNASVDMWAFPSLLPGRNTITYDNDDARVQVIARPLYA